MLWLQKYKFALLVFIFLLAINIYIFVTTFYTDQPDYSIQRVKETLQGTGHLYRINLQSTAKPQSASKLMLQFENGSQEMRSVLKQRKDQIELSSSARLEYISLNAPEAETNLTNNSYHIPLWSESASLTKITSEPDYNFLIDEKNRLWFVCSGRVQENEKPAILLTVLLPDGQRLIDNQKISQEGVYSVYPIIQQMPEGKIHILWSSYQDGSDDLCHVIYGETNGTISELSKKIYTEGDVALQHPIFVSNEPGNPLVAVLAKYQFYTGFALYRITENGLVKIPSPLYSGGIVHRDISFFHASKLKDLVLVRDSKDRYTLIWNEFDSMGLGLFYMSTFDEDYQLVKQRTEVGKILALRIKPRLEVIPKNGKLYLFYSEEFNVLDRANQLCYTILDEDGNSLQEDVTFDGPSPVMLRDLSTTLDDNGNFNFIWTDARVSKLSRPNRDLVFKTMNDQLETLTPATTLTNSLVDQMMPQLRYFHNYRYLIWADYKDGAYELFVKSTYPEFLSSLKSQQQWDNFWEKISHFISVALISIGAQLLFLFPLNLLPLCGALGAIYLFSLHRIRDHWLNWVSIFLTVLLFKYINLNLLSKTTILSLTGTYKLSVVTFALTLVLFFSVHQGWKKWQANAIHKSFFLFGWLVTDTMILTLIYYFQQI